MKVAVVVPCYNEAGRLDVDALTRYLTRHPRVNLLFVDDGSTDATWELLQQLVAAAPQHAAAMRLLRNAGKAEAVRKGMLELISRDAEVVGFWDADLATPLSNLPLFLDVLEENPGIEWVIGSRVRLLGRRVERRAVRHYFGRAFATVASLALAMPVYDTQCGAKLFRVTPGLERILSLPFTSRWIFDVEMMRRLSLLDGFDCRRPSDVIYELPLVEWHDVKNSRVRPTDFPRALLELIRIRFGDQRMPAANPALVRSETVIMS